MNDSTTVRRLRCLLVWSAVTGAGLALAAGLRSDLRPAPGASLEDLLVAAAAWALCAAALWASAVTGVVALEAARTGASSAPGCTCGRPAGRAVPVVVRRVLLRACGTALSGGLATGLAIAPAPAHSGTQLAPPPPSGPVAPGPAATHAVPASHLQAADGAGLRVTTRPGDSLWRVAEARLRAETGHEPSDAEVAAYWPRIHATNRILLGPDPDFVLPGVPLVLPAVPTTATPDEEPS